MAGIQWESLKVCLLNNQPLYVCPPPPVRYQREHGHAASPRAPALPGLPAAPREEAGGTLRAAGGARPGAQRPAHGLVAPAVPLLSLHLIHS